MTYKIAIASGKGGTGKTTVSVNLFNNLNDAGCKVLLADCDVEEPNDFIFMGQQGPEKCEAVYQLVPKIDTKSCTFCRKCVEYCEFNAISVIQKLKYAEVNPSLCHSCGACIEACNFGAISEYKQEIGTLSYYRAAQNKLLVEGRLKVGSPMQTMMVKAVKNEASKNSALTIFDAPPGTSCRVVETISDVDLVLLVTEPTPFGLHDFKLMVSLVKEMNKDFAVIINKDGSGNNALFDYIQSEKIEILGRIPFSKEYAGNYSRGQLMDNIPENITKQYSNIAEKVLRKINKR
jgi:MinD superfamily P-loop ATPase